jgi:hypothetical protein
MSSWPGYSMTRNRRSPCRNACLRSLLTPHTRCNVCIVTEAHVDVRFRQRGALRAGPRFNESTKKRR